MWRSEGVEVQLASSEPYISIDASTGLTEIAVTGPNIGLLDPTSFQYLINGINAWPTIEGALEAGDPLVSLSIPNPNEARIQIALDLTAFTQTFGGCDQLGNCHVSPPTK